LVPSLFSHTPSRSQNKCSQNKCLAPESGPGEHEQARQLLGSVRQTFLEAGNPYKAALAALDLVVSHLEEGNTAEVRVLADEMVAKGDVLAAGRSLRRAPSGLRKEAKLIEKMGSSMGNQGTLIDHLDLAPSLDIAQPSDQGVPTRAELVHQTPSPCFPWIQPHGPTAGVSLTWSHS
jgi:hypothetical protein